MLSYRHAFHAGGAADVLKHSVLVFCLDYMLQKEKPLLCVDTHAGAGAYALQQGYAAQNREWEQGLGKFPAGRTAGLPPLLARYLELCPPEPEVSDFYPGSPLIMSRLLRPGDRLVCCELHPADFAICKAALDRERGKRCRSEVRQTDGFACLKGLLPPPSRRGLIFIDPSYEIKTDYDRTLETLAAALKRFAGGTYIIWYPLLKEPSSAGRNFPERLWDLHKGNRLLVELYTARKSAAQSPRDLYGNGLVIFNPPWTLAAALEESLPVLSELLGMGKTGWKIDTG